MTFNICIALCWVCRNVLEITSLYQWQKNILQTVTTFSSNMSVLDQLILYTVRTKWITEEAEWRTFQPSSDRPSQFRAGVLGAPWCCLISSQFKIQYSTVTEHLNGTHINLALLILLKVYFHNTLSFKNKLNLHIKIQWPRLIIPSQPPNTMFTAIWLYSTYSGRSTWS